MRKPSGTVLFLTRLATVGQMAGYFASGRRIFMLPLLLLILLSGLLLILAGGLSYVAPFVYAIF